MSPSHSWIAAALVSVLICAGGAIGQQLRDHGVGTPLAERRGVVGVEGADGHDLVIACSTDLTPRGWILVTDLNTGETEQIYAPDDVPGSAPYGSLVADSGLFYTAMGDTLLEFDPKTREWTFHAKIAPAVAFLRIIEGPNGTIWAGDVYRAGLVSYDPKTGEVTDHGPMDEPEQYLSHLAYDDQGWIYCGIGTGAYKIVAFNPATDEKRQIVPEDELAVGTAYVYTGVDGNAYGRAGEQWYRLNDGAGTRIEESEAGERYDTGDIYWGDVKATFPDGRAVESYSMVDKYMIVREPDGETRRLEFDYESEGSGIRVVCAGPDGLVYANSAHPSRFIVYDPQSDTLEYRPDPIAMKGFAVQGPYVCGGHYGGGKLYVFDTREPWNMHPRADLIEGAEPASTLAERATADGGEIFYLEDHEVVFLKGADYGAQMNIPLSIDEAGSYYLLVATYEAPSYARGQVLLDGGAVGEPFDPRAKAVGPGPVLTLGPFDLQAGEHTVGIRALEGDAQNPWLSVRTVMLTDTLPDEPLGPPVPNPRLVAEYAPDVNVPWGALAHPDGEHVLISGNPGYGYIGGGIGIYDLATGESTTLPHTELVENHSTMDMVALANGDVVGCTSVAGGHGTTAVSKDAMLYLLDWETKKVQWREVPIEGLSSIVSLVVGPDDMLYCIGSDSTLFVFDPETREVVQQVDLGVYGRVPHQPIALGPDGAIYLLLSNAILRIHPDGCVVEKVADAPGGIEGGIAIVDGRIYFSIASHLWSAEI